MTAEEYLDRIHKIDAMIENKLDDHHRWVGIATGIGGGNDGERVGTGRHLDKIPNAVAHYCDIEQEISELRQERKDIIGTIERLPTIDYKIIYALYVNGLTIKEVSGKICQSCEFVKKHKKRALARIEAMIED